MENPSPQNQKTDAGEPLPEVLKPRTDIAPAAAPTDKAPTTPPAGSKPGRRRSYRPSHRATFIGVAVVALILAINAGILAVVLKSQAKTNKQLSGQVSISSKVLSGLGVNTASLGDSGVQLTVDPDAQFNGAVKVAGAVNISGQLNLNSKFVAANASLTQLQAGDTELSQLNVNGNTTLSTLSLRSGLNVQGTTQFLGGVSVSQLLTVNNLTVTGSLSVNSFSAKNLVSNGELVIGGHILTSGSAPGVGPGGGALGSNGTVGISGNDSAGTVSINIGTGASAGTLANVAFRNQYGATPRITITPIDVAANFYILNVTSSGFSIGVGSGLSPGGYSIDYIIEQ